MLRQTLSRWLENKSVRPVISRAARTAGRPLPTLATTAAAPASSSPGYHSGNMDGLEDAESLDLMDDIPIEPLGRPLHTRALAHGSGRNASAQAMLSRLERKYHLPPADVQSGAAEHKSVGRQEQRSSTGSVRRVMSTPRRPHSPHPSAGALEEDAHTNPVPSSSERATMASHAGHTAAAAAGTSTGSVDNGHEPSHGAKEEEEDEGSAEASPSPNAAKSTDAYRFLLNHIDAEIAALQRRHSSVTTRRQNVQTRQTQRIKELFELMEAPWILLPTEMQPALPATGVDVYIKEQQLARQQRLSGGGSSTNAAGQDGQDKMYVLALHKNYKSMPAGRKRFYEEAASYNAAVRAEMKFQLTRGCTHFEAFLDRVKECTMDMAREGHVPELPSGRAHQRLHAQRSTPGSRYDGARRVHSAAEATEEVSRGRKQRPQAVRETPEDGEEEGLAEGGEAAEEPLNESSPAPKAAKKKGRRASRRIKEAVKTSAKGSAGGAAAGVGSVSSKSGKGGGGRKAPAPAKASHAATASKGKKKATKEAKPAKAAGGGASGARSKKSASAAASPGGSGVSRSIPLPNLGQLAVKKTKQAAVQPAKKKKTAPAVSKASKAKAAGGRKR